MPNSLEPSGSEAADTKCGPLWAAEMGLLGEVDTVVSVEVVVASC